MSKTDRRRFLPDVLRVAAGVGGAVLLVVLWGQIEDFGSAAIYTATWITFLHVCVGEYVLVRYLDARSSLQNVLDLLAAIFLFAGVLSFTSPALWCAFFGGVFALAVTKYLIVERGAVDVDLKRYVREKIRWESPSVVILALVAVVLDQVSPRSSAAHLLQLGILIGTAAFAVWMIGVRHAYRRVTARAGGPGRPDSAVAGGEAVRRAQ